MAISYEEALATLQAMFAEPWTRQSLDAVLRHEKGHMENTCDLILQHGEKDPQILIDRLKAGGPEAQVAMDEELARQLAAAAATAASSSATSNTNTRMRGAGGSGSSSNAHNGRGTPTTLPSDFLRLPGYRPSSTSSSSSSASTRRAAGTNNTNTTAGNSNSNSNSAVDGQPMDDETLARMLQDELFSEELARNPDFAHLAGRQQRRTNSGRGNVRVSSSNARLPQAQPGAPLQNPFEGVNVMQKISSMGDGARRRLQLFANNFENKMKGGHDPNNNNNNNNVTPAGVGGRTGLQAASGAAAERRGLLDDDDDYGDDMIEFETRKSK